MKTVVLIKSEMREAKARGMKATEYVAWKFKKDFDLNFTPGEIKDETRFIFEELVDKTGYKVNYLEGGPN